ncbi:hypothetical protein GCM10010259_21810 [Streptomyces daghestanicus]|uniref:Uncharacterized protein n=1 Tax=Streptomyces daghestanicus TaxID=66885 RepID=A0ABQ3Q6T2_9ACTN|nr:hypothetical protein GCM10010259_21810 [Streptomyces daghestanicus]GHI32959.1 hypothetical protein Sdagh_46890 [Streptomyces daghestanicus]
MAGHASGERQAARVLSPARTPGGDLDEDALRATVRAVPARSRFEEADERAAEDFGLPAGKCRGRPAGSPGSPPRGPAGREGPAGRGEASLG